MEAKTEPVQPVITTELIRNEHGLICLSEPRHGMPVSDDFFYFETRTSIPLAGGKVVSVRTTRAMALGLLTYFLSNAVFQAKVLEQNQAAAIAHFTNRCPPKN